MKVAFWGEASGSGTTSNMLVMTELLAHGTKRGQAGICMDTRHMFVDCGCRRDEQTKMTLRQADLVVINVKQSNRMLDDFFLEYGTVPKHCFFLISRYFKESAYNRQNIEQIYRISRRRMGVIPYNSEFRYACEQGKQQNFVQRGYINKWTGSQQNRDFFRAVRRAAYDLQKCMDEIEGGILNGNCI
jgi:hypothetical protein